MVTRTGHTAPVADALTRAVVDCWNRADWAAYRDLTAPGFTYREQGSGRVLDDVDLVVAAWRRLRTRPRAEVVQVRSEGADSVACVVWRVTDGAEPTEHRTLQLWDLVAFRWERGRVLTETHRTGLLSLLDAGEPVPG